MLSYEVDPSKHDLSHFSRLRAVKQSHVFRVMVHINAVEDLLFIHHPSEDLITDGKSHGKNSPGSLAVQMESLKKICFTLLL
jgi:hypothetical protein